MIRINAPTMKNCVSSAKYQLHSIHWKIELQKFNGRSMRKIMTVHFAQVFTTRIQRLSPGKNNVLSNWLTTCRFFKLISLFPSSIYPTNKEKANKMK